MERADPSPPFPCNSLEGSSGCLLSASVLAEINGGCDRAVRASGIDIDESGMSFCNCQGRRQNLQILLRNSLFSC